MLIGVELCRQTVLADELVVVRHLGIANYIFKAVIFLGDQPDM
jgi:hypothetical protein